MMQFNQMQDTNDKIFFLDEKLNQLGLGALPLYEEREARERRRRNLTGLNQQSFPGTILRTEPG